MLRERCRGPFGLGGASGVDHAAFGGERRLVDRLVHRRVGVHGRDEFFARGFEATGKGELGDQFGRLVADDVGAEDLAAGQAPDDLDEAVGVARGDGLAQRAEVEGAVW